MQVTLAVLVLVGALGFSARAQETCESEDCQPAAPVDAVVAEATRDEECNAAAEESGASSYSEQRQEGQEGADGDAADSSSTAPEQQRESNLNIPLILVLTALFVIFNVFKVRDSLVIVWVGDGHFAPYRLVGVIVAFIATKHVV